MEKIIPKIVFIDTSIFIDCALEEAEDADLKVLKELEDKISKGEMILLLPEIVKNETHKRLEEKFFGLENNIINIFKVSQPQQKNPKKSSKLEEKIKDKCKEDIHKEIETKYKSTKEIIKNIFENKNTILIPLSREVMNLGFMRALLLKAPYNNSQKKPAHNRDRDCVCFDSILHYLKNHKKYIKLEFIICVDDIDYFKDENKEKVHEELEKDLKGKCKDVSIYSNPLEMLNEEFNKKYSISELKKFENVKEVFMTPNDMAFTPRESICFASAYNSHQVTLIPDVMENFEIKFCPYCGKDISKFINNYPDISTYASPATRLFSQKNITHCPYCGRDIEH